MSKITKLFSDDSGISQFSARMRHTVVVNVLWVLCSIPIITAGAATAAAYESLSYMDDADRIASGKLYFLAFRRHFSRATATWAVLVLILVPFLLFWYLFVEKQGISPMVAAVYFLLLFLYYLSLVMSFQVLIRSNGSVGEVLLFSFLAGLKYFLPYVFPVMILSALPLLMFIFATDWFFKLLLLWVVYGFAFTAYLSLLIMKKPFQELSKLGEFILPEKKDLLPETAVGDRFR